MSPRRKIEDEIREHGPMAFSRYMELCLYDPADGYYSRNSEQFGKAGDFYTSSDVHAVFGRLLTRQFEEMWRALDRPPHLEILELGPGRGLFARDVLDWARKKFPGFFAALTYTLQESSPALRAKLEETLRDHLANGRAVIADSRTARIQRSLSIEPPIIIFANEFFDALPVEILSSQGKLHVGIDDGGHVSEIWLPPSSEDFAFLDRFSVHPEAGERIEVPLAAQRWISEIATIQRGFVIVIDYGYTRSNQLAGRHRGTLMAYRQHSTSPNPYEAPGEQDLTAHVNFTALSAALQQAGMTAQKPLTQSQFLMGIGECNQFGDAFEECRLPQERAKVALQLKHLISPEGMGENFQVLIAARGVDMSRITSLSGLSFGRPM